MVVHERLFDKDRHLAVNHTEIPTHRCNDADYLKLHKMNKHGSYHFDYLRKSGAFRCLNDTDANNATFLPKLFGQDNLGEYQSLEIKVVRNGPDVVEHKNMKFLMVSNQELPVIHDFRTT